MTTTVGELTNVPAPGDPIRSQIINDLSSRVVQRFATSAALASQWGTAPNGAVAITLDTYTVWVRKAGTWQPLSIPPTFATVSLVGASIAASAVALGSLNVAAVAYPRRIVVSATAYFGGIVTVPSSIFQLQVVGTDGTTYFANAPGGASAIITGQSTLLAANVAGSISATAVRTNGSDVATVFNDGRSSHLDYLAFPA